MSFGEDKEMPLKCWWSNRQLNNSLDTFPSRRIAQTLSSLKCTVSFVLYSYCIQDVCGIYSFSWHFFTACLHFYFAYTYCYITDSQYFTGVTAQFWKEDAFVYIFSRRKGICNFYSVKCDTYFSFCLGKNIYWFDVKKQRWLFYSLTLFDTNNFNISVLGKKKLTVR